MTIMIFVLCVMRILNIINFSGWPLFNMLSFFNKVSWIRFLFRKQNFFLLWASKSMSVSIQKKLN